MLIIDASYFRQANSKGLPLSSHIKILAFQINIGCLILKSAIWPWLIGQELRQGFTGPLTWKAKGRSQAQNDRSPSSSAEGSPHRDLPTEDFKVMSSSGDWLQDWAHFHSFKWEAPAVPSTCEQLDWGKHSSQTNNLGQLFKSDFNSVSINGEEQLVPPWASTPAWKDMEAATSRKPLGRSTVLAGRIWGACWKVSTKNWSL